MVALGRAAAAAPGGGCGRSPQEKKRYPASARRRQSKGRFARPNRKRGVTPPSNRLRAG